MIPKQSIGSEQLSRRPGESRGPAITTLLDSGLRRDDEESNAGNNEASSPRRKPGSSRFLDSGFRRNDGIKKKAAAFFKGAQDKDASSESSHENAAALQAVLEGGVSRVSEGADAVFVEQSGGAAKAGLSPAQSPQNGEEHAQAHHDGHQRGLAEAEAPAPRHAGDFWLYAAAVSASKVGIEILNLAVPIMFLSMPHAAMAISALYFSSQVAGMFSGFFGGVLIDRLGAGRSMVGAGIFQALSVGILPFVLKAHPALVMPSIFLLFILNGAAGEVFDISRRAVLPRIAGQEEGALHEANGRVYSFRESSGMIGVLAAGWLLSRWGAGAVAGLSLIFYLGAGLAALRFWESRADRAKYSLIPSRNHPRPRMSLFLRERSFDFIEGAKTVLRDPKLRILAFANIPLAVAHDLFHTVIVTVYAAGMLGGPSFAALLHGSWSLGELLGALYLGYRGRESRFSSWLLLAAGAALSMGLLWMFPTPWVAAPIFTLAGMTIVGNELGTDSFIESAVPQNRLGAVEGFISSSARIAGLATLMVCGWAFDVLGVPEVFLGLAVLAAVLSPFYVLAARVFGGASLPDHAEHDYDLDGNFPQGPRRG